MKNKVIANDEFAAIEVRYKRKKMYAVVDAADVKLLDAAVNGTFFANPAKSPPGKFYCVTKIYGKTVNMHQLIISPAYSLEVHHKNNDGLDNRRSNLEAVTHKQNVRYSYPDKDWDAHDAKMTAREARRVELAETRELIAKSGLSRQRIWQIRKKGDNSRTLNNLGLFYSGNEPQRPGEITKAEMMRRFNELRSWRDRLRTTGV